MRASWVSAVATLAAVVGSVAVVAVAAPNTIDGPAQATEPAVRVQIPSQPGLLITKIEGAPFLGPLRVSCSLTNRSGGVFGPVIDQALDIRMYRSQHRPGDRISIGYDIAIELEREMSPYVRQGAVQFSTEGTTADNVWFLAADQTPSVAGGVGMVLLPSTPHEYLDRFRGDIQISWSRPEIGGDGIENVGNVVIQVDIPCPS